jgi:hypothetical protein
VTEEQGGGSKLVMGVNEGQGGVLSG